MEAATKAVPKALAYADPLPDGRWRCKVPGADGKPCGRVFPHRPAVQLHQKAHRAPAGCSHHWRVLRPGGAEGRAVRDGHFRVCVDCKDLE